MARFDFRVRGSGLASQGYSIDRPDEALAYYKRMASTPHNASEKKLVSDVQRYAAGRDLNNAGVAAEAVDYVFRERQRGNQKENGFLSSTLGKIITTAAQIGASFIPGVGPAVSAGIGAVTGGIQGGLKGAVLGGVSGYGVGTGTQWVAQGGISRTFNTLLGKGASSNLAGVTQNAAGYLEQLPAAGSKGVASTVASGAKSLFKGVGSSLNTAATVVNAGVGLRELLAPAGAGAAIALGASAASTPNLDTSPPAAPAEVKSDYELQVEKERKRRRMTQTDVTWGNVLNDPRVKRPTLLGGATQLAA